MGYDPPQHLQTPSGYCDAAGRGCSDLRIEATSYVSARNHHDAPSAILAEYVRTKGTVQRLDLCRSELTTFEILRDGAVIATVEARGPMEAFDVYRKRCIFLGVPHASKSALVIRVKL